MVTLPSGRKVEFDFSRITIAEFRSLTSGALSPDDEDTMIGQVSGMTGAEIASLPYTDYVKLQRAFIEDARNPLADPN